MATVAVDIVRKQIVDKGLDHLIAYNGSKSGGRILDADSHSECLEALDDLAGVGGPVLVVAWKGRVQADGEKAGKGTPYEWTISNGAQGGQVGAFGGAGGPWLQPYVDTKLELERMKMAAEYDTKGNAIGKLGDVLLQYLPVIAHSLGVKLPPPANATDAETEEGEEADTVGGIPEPELEDMLEEVVQYARKNPDQARNYVSMLKNMNGSNG